MAAHSLNLAALDAAVIDLDGTLVDTQGDFVAALNAMLDELALPGIDAAFVTRTVGQGSKHLVAGALAHVGADPARLSNALACYQRHYGRINGDHSTVYPGAEAGLQQLRKHGLRLACLTNKPTLFAQQLLSKKALGGHFEHIFGGDRFARQKPDPLPLRETCTALRSAPERTLMIGDSRNDAQAARAAGCPVLLVSYGYNHGEPVSAVDADGVIDRLDEILV